MSDRSDRRKPVASDSAAAPASAEGRAPGLEAMRKTMEAIAWEEDL